MHLFRWVGMPIGKISSFHPSSRISGGTVNTHDLVSTPSADRVHCSRCWYRFGIGDIVIERSWINHRLCGFPCCPSCGELLNLDVLTLMRFWQTPRGRALFAGPYSGKAYE
jgi:hypothetical protein